MISAKTREYDFYQYDAVNGYGQPMLSEDVKGTVKMAVFNITKAVQDGTVYSAEEYIGLTNDKNINDTYVIQYGDMKLKVLYTIDAPRLKVQVFMEKI
jgi:hypothetical protein